MTRTKRIIIQAIAVLFLIVFAIALGAEQEAQPGTRKSSAIPRSTQ